MNKEMGKEGKMQQMFIEKRKRTYILITHQVFIRTNISGRR